jgi:hypothetical protein
MRVIICCQVHSAEFEMKKPINQSAKGMLAFLDGYQNTVQCDVHSNYDKSFDACREIQSAPLPNWSRHSSWFSIGSKY